MGRTKTPYGSMVRCKGTCNRSYPFTEEHFAYDTRKDGTIHMRKMCHACFKVDKAQRYEDRKNGVVRVKPAKTRQPSTLKPLKPLHFETAEDAMDAVEAVIRRMQKRLQDIA